MRKSEIWWRTVGRRRTVLLKMLNEEEAQVGSKGGQKKRYFRKGTEHAKTHGLAFTYHLECKGSGRRSS